MQIFYINFQDRKEYLNKYEKIYKCNAAKFNISLLI